MEVRTTSLPGVLLFIPSPHRDGRGFFTRTFDTAIAAAHGLDATAFQQDSQSRTGHAVVRGLHGRGGRGEAKMVRCARGAVFDVIVDARPGSPTFGQHESFRLDDETFHHLYIPPGLLHGYQVLSDVADVCYRIDRPHDAREDLTVRYDDPKLGIAWPLPSAMLSARDAGADSWQALADRFGGEGNANYDVEAHTPRS